MMESSERGRSGEAVSMEIPASEGALSCSPPTVPSWLRRKLSEPKTPPPTSVQEIEAKLRDADIRRQKFYENLSSKARSRPRSPIDDSPNQDDLGQRLEAKLLAAEEKRLSILTTAQTRLAKLHELRQAAKAKAEMRLKRQRAELGTKVQLRFQKAEANRMLLLREYMQRRENLKERVSQSLMRQVAREIKHKERIHSAMHQKRAHAEKKRQGLLEEERRRARARFLQVQKVASSVYLQREIERSEMKSKIDGKLQKAGIKRAEYLQQRGRQYNAFLCCWETMNEQSEILAIKLARCWRRFKTLRKTTASLAKAYYDLYISERSVKSMPFEQFALLIQSNATIQTVKAFLDRLEVRYRLCRLSLNSSECDDINHLLKRVGSPKRKEAPRKVGYHKEEKKVVSVKKNDSHQRLSRYQVRVVLCAYMIVAHPDAVISGQGDREMALVKSAENFVKEFDLLVKIVLNGPLQVPDKGSDDGVLTRQTFRSQLAAFDSAWCSFLNSFVVWKAKDAKSLEEDLIKAACRLELSMIKTCKMTPEGESVPLSHDMKEIQKQVSADQKLLREKVLHLSGSAGIERLENALSDARDKFFNAKEGGYPMAPLTPRVLSASSSSPSLGISGDATEMTNGFPKQRPVARSLFSTESENSLSSNGPRENLYLENASVVNEYVHGNGLFFEDRRSSPSENQDNIMAMIKETMERAFWDGIIESIRQDEPDYSRVVGLMREVRDGIGEVAPQNWRDEINEAIDVEILTQVLNSGTLDVAYLGNILEFSLRTLRKLSAAALEPELMKKHKQFMEQLSDECAQDNFDARILALVKGLRYVLVELQDLKQEISKARIKMLEPVLRGPEALYFLENAFTRVHGRPSDAPTSLPRTAKWLSSVQSVKDEEWNQHKNSLSESSRSSNSSSFLPLTALRTGGRSLVKGQADASSSSNATTYIETIDPCLECKGEEVDLSVRLALLKLVTKITGLTEVDLPETMTLNLHRLRNLQSQIQRIVVIATSLLIMRQTLLSQRTVSSQAQMDNILMSSRKRLSEFLDSSPDAGIPEIIHALTEDNEKLQPMKEIMGRMLSKSLQEDDAVFTRVFHAVYLSFRGVVLGGTGSGKALAETALQTVGASPLVDDVVAAASPLVVAAKVSVIVHGQWYKKLLMEQNK